MLLLAIVTWRRANAAQALSIDDGFRSIVMNLPISAPLRNNQIKYSRYSKINKSWTVEKENVNENRTIGDKHNPWKT